MLKANESDFEERVLKADGKVLVDFWASWCPPCKMMEPMLTEMEKQLPEGICFVSVNVDQNPGLASRYSIAGVPAFLLFVRGEVRKRAVGAQTHRQIRALLEIS